MGEPLDYRNPAQDRRARGQGGWGACCSAGASLLVILLAMLAGVTGWPRPDLPYWARGIEPEWFFTGLSLALLLVAVLLALLADRREGRATRRLSLAWFLIWLQASLWGVVFLMLVLANV